MSTPKRDIVVIEGCTASQLVGQETIELGSGTLTLQDFEDKSSHAKLLIKIADSTFALPIEEDAIVGTRGDRSYLFSKKIAPAKEPEDDTADLKEVPIEGNKTSPTADAVSLVQIDMSPNASEESLTKFEMCLVDHGFLTVGVQADADNLSRSFLEWTGLKTRDLRSFTHDRTSSGKSTDDPAEFSETTHKISSGAASGSASFADAATKIGDTIDTAIDNVGSFLGSKIGTKGIFSGPDDDASQVKKDAKEAFSDGVESVAIVGSGIVDGAKHVGSQASQTTSQAVEHNYGADALKITEETGTAVANTASVGVTAMQQSSMMMHGAVLGKGAVSEEK